MAATEERAGVTSWTFAAADAVEHAGYFREARTTAAFKEWLAG